MVPVAQKTPPFIFDTDHNLTHEKLKDPSFSECSTRQEVKQNRTMQDRFSAANPSLIQLGFEDS